MFVLVECFGVNVEVGVVMGVLCLCILLWFVGIVELSVLVVVSLVVICIRGGGVF